MSRSTYGAELIEDNADSLCTRNITPADADLLGELIFAAYFGTIDHKGESLDDFKQELFETLFGRYGEVNWNASFLSTAATVTTTSSPSSSLTPSSSSSLFLSSSSSPLEAASSHSTSSSASSHSTSSAYSSELIAISTSLVTMHPRLGPLLAFASTIPSHQKRGLARALIKKSLASLSSQKIDTLSLVVTPGNDSAISLYEKLGFIVRSGS